MGIERIVDFFGEITDATSEKDVNTLKRMSVTPAVASLPTKDVSPANREVPSGDVQEAQQEQQQEESGKLRDAKIEKLPNLLPSGQAPACKKGVVAAGQAASKPW